MENTNTHEPIKLETLPPELAAALVHAQKSVRPVPKDGFNQHHQYAYPKADTMVAEGREACTNANLVLLTLGWTMESLEWKKDKDPIGRVHVTYLLVHASGACVGFKSSTYVIPERGRPSDKAESGALTNNLAYVYRGLLSLAREDAASTDARDDQDYDPAAQAPAQQPRPEPRRGYEATPAQPVVERPPPTVAHPAGRLDAPPRTNVPQAPEPAHRSAADAAVDAQVGPGAAHPPRRAPPANANGADDPAHLAMALELQRQVMDTSVEPADVFARVHEAKLPKHLADACFAAVFEVGFGLCHTGADLDTWIPTVRSVKLEGAAHAATTEAFEAAAERVGWQPQAAA